MLQEIKADYCEWVSEMYGTPGKQSLWFGYIFTWLQITFLKVFFIVGETTFRFSNENNISTLIRSIRNVFLLVFKTFFNCSFYSFPAVLVILSVPIASNVVWKVRWPTTVTANKPATSKLKSWGKTKKSRQNEKVIPK